MSRENSKKNYKLLIVFLIILIIGVIGLLFFFLNSGNNSVPEIAHASEQVSSASVKPSEDTKPADVKIIKNPIDFKALKKKNDEIVAWIKIPDTNVDYPVVQSRKADDFYLHRDVNRNSSYAGSIYMEYCNSIDFTDRVTVLYGHNMQNGSMFANLHKFENPDFFNKHRYFFVYLPDRRLKYEVVSAYNYSDKHIMNSYNFSDNKVFKEYLEYMMNPRSAVRNVRKKLNHKLTTDDRVLTLSTCLNIGDGRYLLQGVLVKDEFTE